ncbi:transglutaminase family protein [Roseibacterium sp. SDUM158016]|uniref:transglutaminase family protein n=1 Tax=Roseicyclus sediminis TaxID=2980997 RepID=UPI0021D2A765|nr:transglutaminase family protein [Roseibacterium sp. SDUM158016]MCU4653813.1 transglutaminase family protein [Roseibacterium sp. SDUM158016]
MRLKILHTTTYHFDQPVPYGLQQLRLIPKSRAGQAVVEWKMDIEGGVEQLQFNDHHQNRVSLLSFDPGATSIVVHCEGEVETADLHGVIGKHAGFAPLWLFGRSTELTRAGPNVRRLAKGLREEHDEDIPRLHALIRRILDEIPYEIGTTNSDTTAEEAIEHGCGVCQDHAHIFLAAARSMGYPARYVSGYLMMNDRVHQDASHAWAEAHVEGIGWVGFDVSNGISPDARYVRVATGLDYREAAPVSGLRFGHGGEALSIDIQVQQQ